MSVAMVFSRIGFQLHTQYYMKTWFANYLCNHVRSLRMLADFLCVCVCQSTSLTWSSWACQGSSLFVFMMFLPSDCWHLSILLSPSFFASLSLLFVSLSLYSISLLFLPFSLSLASLSLVFLLYFVLLSLSLSLFLSLVFLGRELLHNNLLNGLKMANNFLSVRLISSPPPPALYLVGKSTWNRY